MLPRARQLLPPPCWKVHATCAAHTAGPRIALHTVALHTSKAMARSAPCKLHVLPKLALQRQRELPPGLAVQRLPRNHPR